MDYAPVVRLILVAGSVATGAVLVAIGTVLRLVFRGRSR